ncbi:MAG: hypothetical protein QOJ96_642 [Alphaproteobacteria bacterium]|jgi:hypothetical protein|nr:hypothetical protein [Alphaproteobacteria bacterium]
MNYYLDLFTPETWAAFKEHGATISGFRERQRKTAERIKPGDKFLCYLVRLSRWCGILEVNSEMFTDSSPIFTNPDPFLIRFNVTPIVKLDLEQSIPMLDEEVWSRLSLTKGIERGISGWAQHANLRASLRQMNEKDSRFLSELLLRQNAAQRIYPFSPQDKQRLGQKASIRTIDRAVLVEVPAEEKHPEILDAPQPIEGIRDSHRIQGTIAKIGAEMGFRIWIPRSDKQKILGEIPSDLHSAFLDVLPLNYDDTTLRTVEQIDVIWLRGRSMSRAFEVEHTTAIYSGLLRMADLLALQPNMDIRLHIVAPAEKREKVLREIKRPVFSLLDRGPLYENCSYLPYEAIQEISEMKHLGHMSDSIIEEYEEFAQDE